MNAPGHHVAAIVRRHSGQSSLFASLRPLRGCGLDRPCVAPAEGNYVMAQEERLARFQRDAFGQEGRTSCTTESHQPST